MLKGPGKRSSFCSIQLSHHVPCDNGDISRVRTGYEQTIAHFCSDEFAYAAHDDGYISEIDPKLQIVKIQYNDVEIETHNTLTLALPSTEISHRRSTGEHVGYVIADGDIKDYPVGKMFRINKTTVAEVTDVTHITSADAIKDLPAKRQASHLVMDLESGHRDSLYYVSLVLKPSMRQGPVDVVRFGDDYSSIPGAHLTQTTVINVIAGQHVKKGDIIAYNRGFFKPIPGTTQVAWKHGVSANVALIETSDTLEDGCTVSSDFAQKMKMKPASTRGVLIDHRTVISDVVDIGAHVETTDPVCTIMDGDLAELTDGEMDRSIPSFLGNFNDHPTAKHHGTIARIDVYYACALDELSDSLRALVAKTAKKDRALQRAMEGTLKEGEYHPPGEVPVGTKYAGVDFQPGVVLVEFMIASETDLGQGDKICIMNANKSVISAKVDRAPMTESGVPVDIIYATTSIYNRIVNSPIVVGTANRVLEYLERKIVQMWDA